MSINFYMYTPCVFLLIQCLLLNDMVVFAAKGATRTSEVEKTLELVTLWCMDLEDNNPQSGLITSFEKYGSRKYPYPPPH